MLDMKRTPLRRGTKRLKRSWLNPTGKKAHRRRLRAAQFGEQAGLCRRSPCSACGRRAPSDPHHVIPRSRGGLDEHTIPLCRSCHRHVHSMGEATFQRIFGVNFIAIAAQMQRAA